MSSPVHTTPPTGQPPMTKTEKRRERKERHRHLKAQNKLAAQESPKPQTGISSAKMQTALPKPKLEGKRKDTGTVDTSTDDEQQDLKAKLADLQKRTKDLEVYVNQIQDVVTIGMQQLRELKLEITALASARK